MNYHFCIEGPDGVGKSTLADQLKNFFNIPVIRLNVKTLNGIEIASQSFNETIVQFKQYPFILDRWWISSKVYAKVYNRTDDFSYLKHFAKILPNSYLIYLYSPIEVLLSRKQDELIHPAKLKEICLEYDTLITSKFCNENFHYTIKIDTSKSNQFKKVLEFMGIEPPIVGTTAFNTKESLLNDKK